MFMVFRVSDVELIDKDINGNIGQLYQFILFYRNKEKCVMGRFQFVKCGRSHFQF